jgi:hypothetical protein
MRLKSNYYYSFKIRFGDRPETRPGSHIRRVNLVLSQVNIKIKTIIIIVLKPDLRVNLRQGSGH